MVIHRKSTLSPLLIKKLNYLFVSLFIVLAFFQIFNKQLFKFYFNFQVEAQGKKFLPATLVGIAVRKTKKIMKIKSFFLTKTKFLKFIKRKQNYKAIMKEMPSTVFLEKKKTVTVSG